MKKLVRPFARLVREPSQLMREWTSSPRPGLKKPDTQAIKHGDFLKVSAEREGIRVEVHFNFNANASSRNKGICEIHGGPLAGTGVIVDVKREQVSDFKDFFT